MDKLESIEEQWQSLATRVLPNLRPGMPQYDDMRKAFFSGAFCLFMFTKRLGEPDISEDEGCRYLDRIEEELLTFVRGVA